MIETRYNIEYIDPSTGKQRSAIGRFFIYSALTFSILAAIAALIFSNLPDNTSRLLTDKVKEFTSSITEPQSSPAASPDTIMDTEVAITNTNEEKLKENQKIHKDELAQQKLLATKNADKYKTEIDLLTQENTEQHEHTIKLVKENQTLTAKIDDISKQLETEKQKKSELLKNITALQTKNKTASDLLEKTTETNKTYASELKNLKQKELNITDTPATNEATIQSSVAREKVVEKTAEKIETETKTTRNTAKTTPEEAKVKEKSQVDAIVAAMEAASQATSTQASETNNSNTK